MPTIKKRQYQKYDTLLNGKPQCFAAGEYFDCTRAQFRQRIHSWALNRGVRIETAMVEFTNGQEGVQVRVTGKRTAKGVK